VYSLDISRDGTVGWTIDGTNPRGGKFLAEQLLKEYMKLAEGI
jgi:hypothetical protein